MYAVIRDRADLADAVKLFYFESSARDFLAAECAGDATATVTALTETTERRILAALREHEELSITLQTGLGRRTRGTR